MSEVCVDQSRSENNERSKRRIVSASQIGTRQMVNHRYGVCVRMALGYCTIEWSQIDRFSFSVSGDTGSFDPDIIGRSVTFSREFPV